MNGDYVYPEIVIATFSDELTLSSVRKIKSAMEHGHEMLKVYMEIRSDWNIAAVHTMLEKMDRIYLQWQQDNFLAERESEE